MRPRVGILVGLLVGVLVAAALAMEAVHFARFASIFFNVPPTSDSELFLAMGRGWLNGLTFYRDLFETKPPGVFLLAALALRLGGGFPLFVWFQLILLALLGVLAGFSAYKCLDRSDCPVRWLVLGMTILLGFTIAVETLYRTGGYLAEGFGLVFATVPALMFRLPASGHRRLILDVLAGLSLGVAAMFMEPFLVCGVLAMLVFCSTRRDGWRLLRILIVSGAVFLAILVLSGSFVSYFSLYLPEMLGGRSTATITYPHFGLRYYYVLPAPLWLRSVNVYRLFSDLASPVQAGLLSVFFGVCLWLWVPLRSNDFRHRTVLVSAAIIVTALLMSHQVFILYEMVAGLHGLGRDVPWGDAIIARLVALTVGPPVALVVALFVVPRRLRPPWRVAGLATIALIGLVMATTLVALGGGNYPARYLVFAFPPFLALAIYCMSALAHRRHYLYLGLLALLLLVNAGMPDRFDDKVMVGPVLNRAPSAQTLQRAAVAVDALLTSCHESRYLLANPQLQAVPAFTLHSPDQITYGKQRALGGFGLIAASDAPNSFLAGKLKEDLSTVRIILAAAGDDLANAEQALRSVSTAGQVRLLTMDAQPGVPVFRIAFPIATVMRDEFTTNPPPCAQGMVPIAGLQVFFRRQ